jgi:hypothetical protein
MRGLVRSEDLMGSFFYDDPAGIPCWYRPRKGRAVTDPARDETVAIVRLD